MQQGIARSIIIGLSMRLATYATYVCMHYADDSLSWCVNVERRLAMSCPVSRDLCERRAKDAFYSSYSLEALLSVVIDTSPDDRDCCEVVVDSGSSVSAQRHGFRTETSMKSQSASRPVSTIPQSPTIYLIYMDLACQVREKELDRNFGMVKCFDVVSISRDERHGRVFDRLLIREKYKSVNS